MANHIAVFMYYGRWPLDGSDHIQVHKAIRHQAIVYFCAVILLYRMWLDE